MKTSKRNSQWLSDTYELPSGDSPWTSQTPIIEGKLRKVRLDSTSTTSNLVTYEKLDIQAGDKLLIKSSSDANYSQEITVEGVTVSAGAGTMTYDASRSNESGANGISAFFGGAVVPSTFGGQHWKFSDDGYRAWIIGPAADYLYIRQLELAVPFDLGSIQSVSATLPVTYITGMGFQFANRGRFLYVPVDIGSYASWGFTRWVLSTPYDISTAMSPTQYATSAFAGSADYLNSAFAFNEDGTRFITFRKASNQVTWGVCSTPWDLQTFSATTSGLTVGELHANFSDDGKYAVFLFDDIASASGAYFKILDMTAAPATYTGSWATVPFTSISEYGAAASYGLSTSNNTYSVTCMSNDLRYISKIPYTNSTSYTAAFTTTLGEKTSIDISTQGLTSVPEDGYLYISAAPKYKFAVNNSSQYRSILNERLATWSSTTTSATIYSDKETLVSVGDTVLLNNEDSVTVTSVTTTSKPRVSFTAGANAGRYVQSKIFGHTGSNVVGRGVNPRFNFSNDGSKLFILVGSPDTTATRLAGMYQYDLGTPWDISTAEPSAIPFIDHKDISREYSDDNIPMVYNSAAVAPVGLRSILDFEFSTDGTSVMFLFLDNGTMDYKFVHMQLDRAYDILGPRTVTVNIKYFGLSTSYSWPWGFMFNNDGSEFWVREYHTSGSPAYFYSTSSPTNWNPDISSLSVNSYRTGVYWHQTGARFTPDGSEVVLFGRPDSTNPSFTDNTYGMKVIDLPTTNSFTGVVDTDATLVTTFPAGDSQSGVGTSDHRFSPDGLHWYTMNISGIMHQWDIMLKDGYQHVIEFTTQSTAPDSVWLPDNSESVTLIESSFSAGSIDDIAADVTYTTEDPIDMTGATSIKFKIDPPGGVPAEISSIRVDLQ